jgi:hypothetical protein
MLLDQLGNCRLHLMLCEDFTPPHIHPHSLTAQPHFALSLHKEDFLQTIQDLMDSGIKLIEDIEEFNGLMQAFFYDQDRNMIEINDALQ